MGVSGMVRSDLDFSWLGKSLKWWLMGQQGLDVWHGCH
jgi:hypothetical protein